MKTATLQVKYDADKLSALKQYSQRKDVSIEDELADAIAKLYEKNVPTAVREFIEFQQSAATMETKEKKNQTKVETPNHANDRA